jgi:hypothetical protein
MAEWRTRLYQFVDSPLRYPAVAIVALLAALLLGDGKTRGWLIARFVIGFAVFVMLGLGAWLVYRRRGGQRRGERPPLDLTR